MITVINDATEADWNAYVDQHPDATGYHRWGWKRVFERAFGHECVYLSAVRDGQIAGLLPLVVFDSRIFGRFAVSLPFLNYGGVLAESNEVSTVLLDAAASAAQARRWRHVELRHLTAQFADRLPCKQHKVAMQLALENTAETMWARVDRKVRNQVRKAEKSGLSVTIGGVELLEDFYGVFAHNMRDLGTPVYSKQFFVHILTEFPDAAEVFVVKLGSRAVAASITLRWRGVTEVPWASSLREYRSLCPNMLLYWAMLTRAIVRGSTTFDFGRSTPNESTFHFKSQWGATPTPFSWEYWLPSGAPLPDQSPTNAKFKLAIEAWKRLPLSIANRLGPPIVRSIP